MSYFFFFCRLPSLYLCRFFDSVSSYIDGVLSSNLYANAFVFGDLNVHNKDWLTYSGGTDRSDELCYNFSISNDLTQMVNFPTRISHSDSHSTALSDFFLPSGARICSKTSFPPLENSGHVVVSVSIDFPSYSQSSALFQNCLLKNFLRTLILMTQVSLYFFFPPRTNLKLHNISVFPTMVKKVIMNLDLSKAFGPDCILVVVLKNWKA